MIKFVDKLDLLLSYLLLNFRSSNQLSQMRSNTRVCGYPQFYCSYLLQTALSCFAPKTRSYHTRSLRLASTGESGHCHCHFSRDWKRKMVRERGDSDEIDTFYPSSKLREKALDGRLILRRKSLLSSSTSSTFRLSSSDSHVLVS